MRLIWALVPLMLIGLAGCAASPSGGAAQARIDAALPHVGPCAGSLAGEDIRQARADCLPVLVILDGAG